MPRHLDSPYHEPELKDESIIDVSHVLSFSLLFLAALLFRLAANSVTVDLAVAALALRVGGCVATDEVNICPGA